MTDIRWRSPAEMQQFLRQKENITAILLVQNKDDSYDTILVFKDGDTVWIDAPLGQFTCDLFRAHDYQLLAIVDSQEDNHD